MLEPVKMPPAIRIIQELNNLKSQGIRLYCPRCRAHHDTLYIVNGWQFCECCYEKVKDVSEGNQTLASFSNS